MGTNYYLRVPKDRPEEYERFAARTYRDNPEPLPYVELHIGKSSYGWCFALHVIPELDLNSLQDWEVLFGLYTEGIYDEYDINTPVAELMKTICDRQGADPDETWAGTTKTLDRHYSVIDIPWSEWFEQNSAQPGPRGCARHRIGRGCVAHGPSTYDLIVGEFS